MKNMYAWVPWFRELAGRIAEGGEQGLIDRAKRVDWKMEKPPLLRHGDENIDPLSFLYFLSSRLSAMDSVRKEFKVKAALPRDDDRALVFPMAVAVNALLHDGKTLNPELLWDLFRQAQSDKPKVDAETFHSILNSPGVGVFNLTQALCLTNAHAFLPIGKQSKTLGKRVSVLDELGKWKKAHFTLSTFESIMRQAREAFPECRLYEIGRFIYEHGVRETGLVSKESSFFHISTRLRGDKGADFWNEFERENAVWTSGKASAVEWDDPLPSDKKPFPVTEPQVGDIMLVRCGTGQGRGIGVVLHNDFADDGGLAADSRIHVVWVNKTRTGLAQPSERFAMNRAARADRGALPGFAKSAEYGPSFQLFRALRVPGLPVPDPIPVGGGQHLNQILYGPPGTGKTWHTVARAVAIIEGRSVDDVESEDRKEVKQRFDDCRDAGQVEMATFHQNYAYEDFIEGIRPVLGDGEGAGLGFDLSLGVLRRIADAAERNRQDCATSGDDFPDVEELVQAFGDHVEAAPDKVPLSAKGEGDGIYIDRVGRNAEGEVVRFKMGGRTSQYLFKRVVLRDYRSFYEGRIESFKDIKPIRASRRPWMG